MKIEDGLPDNPLDEPAEARVARGARLLDEHQPGWRHRIDRDRLDMGSDYNCVVGQLYGHYPDGCNRLGLTTNQQATRYGFIVMYPDGMAALTPLWLAELDREPATP
jgi:hypothetical protein